MLYTCIKKKIYDYFATANIRYKKERQNKNCNNIVTQINIITISSVQILWMKLDLIYVWNFFICVTTVNFCSFHI